MAAAPADDVASVIEDAVRGVCPSYRFPFTKEQSAALTRDEHAALSQALLDLLNTREFPHEEYDAAALQAEHEAYKTWMRSLRPGE